MHISRVSRRATDAASHQPGTLWVTEGLTVPMATASSFSKVRNVPSSHPVARQWVKRSGRGAAHFGSSLHPTYEGEKNKMSAGGKLVSSFREIRRKRPHAHVADRLDTLNSCISPRRRKSSSNSWGELPVRAPLPCLLQIRTFFFFFFTASVLLDVHYWSYRMLKKMLTVAVNT